MGIEVGSFVEVVDRESSPADQKSGLFYNHFRSLRGVVDRIYADGNLCVVVDHSTLTREMLLRLKRAERVIKPRWKTAGAADAEPETVEAADAAEDLTDDAGDVAADELDETEEEETPGVVEGIGMASAGSRAEATAAALVAAAEDAGDLKVNPGLRYSIVIKPDDVRELDGAARSQGSSGAAPRPEGSPARATTEALRAAELRHMEELRARAQK